MSRLHSLVHSRLVALFGIDVRALAAFRITLALLLVIDIASRLRLLTANYTDAGAHPREAALAHYALDELPSLYMLGGSRWLALALLLATGAAALLLGLGWRTRLVRHGAGRPEAGGIGPPHRGLAAAAGIRGSGPGPPLTSVLEPRPGCSSRGDRHPGP